LRGAPGITFDTIAVSIEPHQDWASPIRICWTKDRTSSRSSSDASLVQRSVKAERRDGVTDFRTRREERAQTVEHQPFDVPCRNAPVLGMLAATASDKRRRDIVSIPLALLDGGWEIGERRRYRRSGPTTDSAPRRQRPSTARADREPVLNSLPSSGSMIAACWPGMGASMSRNWHCQNPLKAATSPSPRRHPADVGLATPAGKALEGRYRSTAAVARAVYRGDPRGVVQPYVDWAHPNAWSSYKKLRLWSRRRGHETKR
jgi:hypothetical protein